MDYRRNGRLLQENWLKRHEELGRSLRVEIEKSHRLHPQHDFLRALVQHARGNSKFLVDYLRSDRPLLALDREHFAQVLEGALARKKPRGRPLNRDMRSAAMQARVFYATWRAENKQAGIKDHGHSNEMKNEAVRFVLHELEPTSPPLDSETVRVLMDRSRSRRKP